MIEKVKIDNQNIIHDLRLGYEDKISQLNHEKSLLLIQVK